MEEQLKKLKSEMLKDELAGFEFDRDMKRKVIGRFESEKPRTGLFQRNVPAVLSVTAFLAFSVGIYWLVESSYTQNHGGIPPAKEEIPVAEAPEEKPELIVPPYVPAGYVFKHTHTNDDVYEHLYMNEQNEAEYFAYIMREKKPEYPVPDIPIDLAVGLDGSLNKISDDHIFLTWQDEGMFQIVERKGSMEESEFYRIAEAILKAKGHEPTLSSLTLESEPVVVLGEKEALEMLQRYNSLWKSVYQEANIQPDGRFPNLKTKEDFYQLFLNFMSYDLVEATFKFRLGEKEDGIYIIPMDPVRSYWPGTPYNLGKISDNEYQLTQIQETQATGRETLVVTYKKVEAVWKIESIAVEPTS